jgi:hypothetical protein
MRCLAAVALIALLGSPARAQPPGSVQPQNPEPPAPLVRKKHKDPAVGVTLAVLGTIGSYALALQSGDAPLVGAGMVVIGPSIGQWYSRQVGVIGITARVAGSYLILIAADPDGGKWANLAIAVGLGLFASSTLYDLWAAHDAAGTYNREHSVQLAPTVMQTAKGPAPGVAASLRF